MLIAQEAFFYNWLNISFQRSGLYVCLIEQQPLCLRMRSSCLPPTLFDRLVRRKTSRHQPHTKFTHSNAQKASTSLRRPPPPPFYRVTHENFRFQGNEVLQTSPFCFSIMTQFSVRRLLHQH